jgi:YD repeat-containing protein
MKRHTLLLTAVMGIALPVYADTAAYSYDAAGRLTSVAYSSGATIVYTYDAAGNLTSRVVTAPPTDSAAGKAKTVSSSAHSVTPAARSASNNKETDR